MICHYFVLALTIQTHIQVHTKDTPFHTGLPGFSVVLAFILCLVHLVKSVIMCSVLPG